MRLMSKMALQLNRINVFCLKIALAVLISTVVALADTSPVIDIYRVVQADLDGTSLGSPVTSLKAFATTSLTPRSARSIVLVPLAKADPATCKALLQRKAGIAGLLLLLPTDLDKGELSADEAANLEALERLLLSGPLEAPVFFGVESEQTKQLVSGVKRFIASGVEPSQANGGYELRILGAPAKQLTKAQAINYNAYLQGTEPDPVLLVTANYDSFAVVPALARGDDSNGSGTSVLLQLLKIFSNLYQTEASRGRLNIMFLLTGAGHLNFDSTSRWIADAKEDFINRIQFVLCLDSLGSWLQNDGALYLHYSKPPKEPLVAQWYGTLKKAAELHGVTLTESHKKVNLSSPYVAWEHEQFAKHKILAATLSGKSTSPPALGRSSLADVASKADISSITKATQVIAEAIARMAYPQLDTPEPIITEGGAFDVDAVFLSQWVKLLGSTPRMFPYFNPEAPLHTALYNVFNQANLEGFTRVRQVYALDKEGKKFYNCSSPSQLFVHKTASITFDAVFLLFNVLYLVVLFVALRVATRGMDDLLAMFKTGFTKKYKRS